MTKCSVLMGVAILMLAPGSWSAWAALEITPLESLQEEADPAGSNHHTTQATGTITAVTVYQGQALVTREVELTQGPGLWEVVVTNLPEHVMPGSLYAEPVDGAEIRSVRYRVRPVLQDVRKEVKRLDEEIIQVQDGLNLAHAAQQVLKERTQYLNKLENFTSKTTNKELNAGVLNAETLVELSTYLFEQHEKIAKNLQELQIECRELDANLQLLNRKRTVITGGSAKTVREAVVFVNIPAGSLPKDGAGKLRVRYLVNQASWTPSYAIRAAKDESNLRVEYYGNVQQKSGENWTDVDMTLSTATPSLVAKAPTLEPLAISLGAPQQSIANSTSELKLDQDYEVAKRQLERARKSLNLRRNQFAEQERLTDKSQTAQSSPPAPEPDAEGGGGLGGGGGGLGGGFGGGYSGLGRRGATASGRYFLPSLAKAIGNADADYALNGIANQEQLLDLANSQRLVRREKSGKTNNEGVSVSYHLSNLTSLPSRSDRQLIQIASIPLEGEFYRLAIPVLTSYVYREAELVNSSQQVLLAGPVSTFVGDEFVGRGDLPTVAVGESFTVGLGIDSSLRVSRELVKKDEQVQGGNRLVDFTYQLILENFDGKAAQIRLMDRLPKAEKSDVKLTLVSTDQPLSENAKYQMEKRKEGILRWDVEVPSQSVGTQRFELNYTMKLEYDKQLTIAGLPLRR